MNLLFFSNLLNRRTIEKFGFYPFWEKNMEIYAGGILFSTYSSNLELYFKVSEQLLPCSLHPLRHPWQMK